MPSGLFKRQSPRAAPNSSEVAEDGENNFVAGDISHLTREEQIHAYGYRRHSALTLLTWILILCSGGLLRLIFHWVPRWMLFATHVRCPLKKAKRLLIVETFQKYVEYRVKKVIELKAPSAVDEENVSLHSRRIRNTSTLPIYTCHGVLKEVPSLRMFTYKKHRYIWDGVLNQFRRQPGLHKNMTMKQLCKQTGLNEHQQKLRQIVYGRNDIRVPVKSVLTLLCLEILNPFYIFQMFSFGLWFWDEYYFYATAIVLLTIFGLTGSIIQTSRTQKKLQRTIHNMDDVTVVRGESKKHEKISASLLVPGDILILPPRGCILHCDAVLLNGSCVVNESMLTGESVPVTKTPLSFLSGVFYDVKKHDRHTLFCGTQVVQTLYHGDENAQALVLQTGYSTSKGSLVRSILYPPPVDYKFDRDSYRFMELLALVAAFGLIYTVLTKYIRGVPALEIAMDALDLITIVVPPALPAAMAVGRMYAQIRLKENGIDCISPRTINVSGSTDCVCFDKTGTLTEEDMDMWGVVPVADTESQTPIHLVTKMEPCLMFYGLATCHSLTLIEGKLFGDPLDLKMFESTEWILEQRDKNETSRHDSFFPRIVKPKNAENKSEVTEIGIVRQFPFSSALQRMSVITKARNDKQFMVYCKGSPERLLCLCDPETVPPTFNRTIGEYTEKGYRVLALAYKPLEKATSANVRCIQRAAAEKDLILLGLVVLENKLKPETKGVIQELRQANVNTIMVTGDNMLTSLSVARDCGIVPSEKRVITVHFDNADGRTPKLSFSNNFPPLHIWDADSGSSYNTCFGSVETIETVSAVTDLENSPSRSPSSVDRISSDYVFAMTGSTWGMLRESYVDLIPKILTRGAVFARMLADQKKELIKELQALGYSVAMCGDGANDCGALKAANTGISLSDAESSIASSFTSKQVNISCVPLVLREGRAALVTSFGIFKYMAVYSLTQFISVMILYSIESNLTDIQYLLIDLFIIAPIAFFFGRTGSYQGELSRTPPLTSLVSIAPILSMFFQILVVIVIQATAFLEVQNQEWFLPVGKARNLTFSPNAGYENYALFSVSSFQYIISAFIFSKGSPYRMPFYSNYGLIISLLGLTVFLMYLILNPMPLVRSLFEFSIPPDITYRWMILKYPLVNFVLAYLIEDFFIDFIFVKKIQPKLKINQSKKYIFIEHVLKNDPFWPVTDRETQFFTTNETQNVPSDVMLSPDSLSTQAGQKLANGDGQMFELQKITIPLV